jgi:hypothetical protein
MVRVRIQQMEPDLMDIGSHLGDTIRYQTVHEELISKLKVTDVIIVLRLLY